MISKTKTKRREKKEQEKLVVPVLDTFGKEVEKIELDRTVFDGRVSPGSMYRAIHNYLANRRAGTAATKTRGEVSGGGKKPWRQKGTGRARVGSIRSPLWRHGGTIFGPHPRDFRYHLPLKIKRLALHSSLNDRIANNSLVVLNSLMVEDSKTKTFAALLKKLKFNTGKVLFVVHAPADNLILSMRNIPNIDLCAVENLSAYDVVLCSKLVITKDALQLLTKRLK